MSKGQFLPQDLQYRWRYFDSCSFPHTYGLKNLLRHRKYRRKDGSTTEPNTLWYIGGKGGYLPSALDMYSAADITTTWIFVLSAKKSGIIRLVKSPPWEVLENIFLYGRAIIALPNTTPSSAAKDYFGTQCTVQDNQMLPGCRAFISKLLLLLFIFISLRFHHLFRCAALSVGTSANPLESDEMRWAQRTVTSSHFLLCCSRMRDTYVYHHSSRI